MIQVKQRTLNGLQRDPSPLLSSLVVIYTQPCPIIHLPLFHSKSSASHPANLFIWSIADDVCKLKNCLKLKGEMRRKKEKIGNPTPSDWLKNDGLHS